MKQIKIISAILAALLCVLFITSCEYLKIPLYAPENLAVDEGERMLTWDAVPWASGYVVAIDGEEQPLTADTKYSLSELTEYKTYSLKVKAKGDAKKFLGDSEWSEEVNYTPAAPARTKLSAPRNIQLSDYNLTWDAVENANGYIISVFGMAKIGYGNIESANEIFYETDETSYFLTILQEYDEWEFDDDPNVYVIRDDYTIRVKAKGNGAEYADSDWSVSLKYPPVLEKLSAPVNLQISNGTLTWDAVENAKGYKISISLNNSKDIGNGEITLIELDYNPKRYDDDGIILTGGTETPLITETSYSLDGLTAYGMYQIKVKAIGNGVKYKNSDWSEAIEYEVLERETAGLSFIFYDIVGYFVAAGTATDENIIIPATYEGEPVFAIAPDGFRDKTFIKTVSIPNSVVLIGADAFYNTGIWNNTPNNSVVYADKWSVGYKGALSGSLSLKTDTVGIGDSAFYGYTGLTSIKIPNSVTSIWESAFYNTGIWNNAADNGVVYADKWAIGYKGTLSGSLSLKTDTVGIGIYAFSGYTGLTSIEIPDSVTTIGISAFSFCSGLTSVKIPNNVTTIGIYAFAGSGLTSVETPSSVTHIGIGAFISGSLESIVVEENNKNYKSVDNCLLTKDGKTLILGCKNSVIPDGVTSIGSEAFEDCTGLTSIKIPNSVTSIGDYAFRDCSGLTSIEIPNSVTSIGKYAFYRCSANLESIIVAEGNKNYKSIDNCLLTKDEKTLILGCKNSVIPDDVTSIGDYAFEGCSGLTSIVIPNSVTSIGSYAFSGCSGLTRITFSENSKLTTIGDAAFYGCFGLESITFGENSKLTTIGGGAFADCYGLKSIEIPNSVIAIGTQAFADCYGLKSIEIPNSVMTIGYGAFESCKGLMNIVIPDSVITIGDYAFENCSKLQSITISRSASDGIITLGRLVFIDCSALASIYVPAGSVEEYKAAENWKDYASKIKAIEA